MWSVCLYHVEQEGVGEGFCASSSLTLSFWGRVPGGSCSASVSASRKWAALDKPIRTKPQFPHLNTKVTCVQLIVVVRIGINGNKCLAYWLTGYRHTLILFLILSAIGAT